MPSYVTYGRKRKKNKTSKIIFALLAIASLVLVIFMFIEYTTSLTLKKDLDNEIEGLNTQSSYLATQKQEKTAELELLEKEMAALEAEYVSYQD